MIECPHCETQNQPTHRYCGKCGAEIQRPCPSCKELMQTTRSFCGKCGASLELAPEPEWDEEDRRLMSRLKGVLLALLVMAILVLPAAISGVLPDIEYVLPVLTILMLLTIAPVLVNTAIALKPSGMRMVFTEKTFFVQALREMVDFPGRIMRSDPRWTWFALILAVVTVFITVALDSSSYPIETVGDILAYAVALCLGIMFLVSLVFWFRHLSFGTFLKLGMSAALRSMSGVLIGSLVAIVIVGLEIAVINGVFGLGLYDDLAIAEFIAFGVVLGGGLLPAFAWLSESFDRDLLLGCVDISSEAR